MNGEDSDIESRFSFNPSIFPETYRSTNDLAAATGTVTVATTTTYLAAATATAVAKVTATALALTNATTTLLRLVVPSPCLLRHSTLSLASSLPVVWVAATPSASLSVV